MHRPLVGAHDRPPLRGGRRCAARSNAVTLPHISLLAPTGGGVTVALLPRGSTCSGQAGGQAPSTGKALNASSGQSLT
jgi:hypothetical protein